MGHVRSGIRCMNTAASGDGSHPRNGYAARKIGGGKPGRPHWDAKSRIHTLFLGDKPEKQFSKPAPDQKPVLDEFERQGWPPVMDDPLPFRRNGDRRARLRDTVRSLNRRLITGGIRFYTARNGAAIRWQIMDRSFSEM